MASYIFEIMGQGVSGIFRNPQTHLVFLYTGIDHAKRDDNFRPAGAPDTSGIYTGIRKICPMLNLSLVIPLILLMASTVVLYRRASSQRVSPLCTVYSI